VYILLKTSSSPNRAAPQKVWYRYDSKKERKRETSFGETNKKRRLLDGDDTGKKKKKKKKKKTKTKTKRLSLRKEETKEK
tara:strand:- start:7224 stop:7463 length:240 start_codon:yes stop_codon:yes gene_type:complete